MRKASLDLKIVQTSFFLFTILSLLPNRIKGLPVVLFFTCSIFLYIKNKKKVFPFKQVLFNSSLYLVLLFSLIYTENIFQIDKPLSTALSLLIVPISFGLLKNSIKKDWIKKSFLVYFSVVINLITTIYSLWILVYFMNLGVLNDKMSLNDAIAYITNEMWLISQHPIYASLLISTSLLLLIANWMFFFSKKIIYTFPLIVIQLITLLILSRKSVLLSLIICIFILFFKRIKKIKIEKKKKYFFVIALITMSLLVLTSNRYKELYSSDNFSENLRFNSTSIRYNIYKCSLEKIKDSFFFGYGLGDVQNSLNNCYEKNSTILTEIIYNSHNQYLSYFLSSGLIGFCCLFFFIIFKLGKARKENNVFLMIFVIFFSISMFFENILERQTGVILFSFYVFFFNEFNFLKREI